ncbi:hypothetical protein K474DRAFT_1708903 [Panus rudis PR-1116 ss-1]|nr:hypothetical protein K474DRAFT_1708903 [Panus rudis PR-1116 ss-1]
MEAAATRVYHMLLLLRANDKNIWPIIAGKLPRLYHGPHRAISRGKIDMPAVLDTIAFLSVLNDNTRVALTASVTSSKTTLLVAEDGPGGHRLSDHISTLWRMLREVKEAVDAGDTASVENARRTVFRFLYNTCFHHIATALRTHQKSFECYTTAMQSLDSIDQPEKHSQFLRDIAVISKIVFDGSQCRISLDGGHLDHLIEVCSTLRDFMKERDLLPNWTRRFRSAKDKRMSFSVEKFFASICKLHIYISYILLFASTRSRHQGVLVGPFEVTVVSTNAHRSGNVNASVSELFPLLEYAIDPQERESTLDRLKNRLTTELPQLATQGSLPITNLWKLPI